MSRRRGYDRDSDDGSSAGMPPVGSWPTRQEEQQGFELARKHLKPTPLFRIFTRLYGERKFLVFAGMVVASTLVVWSKNRLGLPSHFC